MGMFRVGTLAALHGTESSQGPGTKAGLANGASSGGWRGRLHLPASNVFFFFFSHVFLAPSNASHGCWNLIPICPGGLWVPCPHPHCHFLLVAMVTAQEGGTFVGVTPFLSSFPVTPGLGYLSQEPRVRAGHVTAGQAWKAQGYRLLWDFVDQ